jgi:predicted HNH restriction endonuclease
MNHLDPSKVHSEWTADEDLVLLTTIRKRGKRWSLAVRELNHTRTEHMVKNRYKSLISNESKKNPEKCESEIEGLLIRRLTKVQERSLKNDSLKA